MRHSKHIKDVVILFASQSSKTYGSLISLRNLHQKTPHLMYHNNYKQNVTCSCDKVH